ncbi:MAG: hypothetical protein ABI273_06140 [Lacunisphaera sp.]
MRTLLPLALLISSISCFSGCSTPASTAENTPAKADASDNAGMPFPKLEVGMTAAAIREKLGAPAEIHSTPSPTGKAEVWIYNYEKDLGTTQVATGTQDVGVMSVGLSASGVTTVQDPTYTTVNRKSEITLSLLMFDDKLQAQKAAVVEVRDHN